MAGTLEEMLLRFLERNPALCRDPSSIFFPGYGEIIYSEPANIQQKLPQILDILRLGIFTHQIYKNRLKEMCRQANDYLIKIRGNLDGIFISLNPELFLELRDPQYQFVPAFDNRRSGYWEDSLDQLMDFLMKTRQIPQKIFENKPEEWPRKLVELTGWYDQFATTPLSKRAVQRGERYDQLKAHSIYDRFIGETSRIGAFNQMIKDPNALSTFLRQGRSGLELALDTALTLRKMLEFGIRKGNETNVRVTKGLCDYLDRLWEPIVLKGESIGFNDDWKDDYFTRIPVCIFNALNKGTLRAGNKAYFSLLYSLDPTTGLLFFSPLHPRDPSQAAVILFEAEDKRGSKFLVLEGLLMNEEYTRRLPVNPQKYALFNPALPAEQRKPSLDFILYHLIRYAYSKGRPLFINMNQITGVEEYGPHELLDYLPDLFPGLKYSRQMIREEDGKQLIVSVSGGDEYYLRKDNFPLLEVLTRNGFDISELIGPDGRLCLYSHTWANPFDRKTWINACDGPVRGKIITLEEMKSVLGTGEFLI